MIPKTSLEFQLLHDSKGSRKGAFTVQSGASANCDSARVVLSDSAEVESTVIEEIERRRVII